VVTRTVNDTKKVLVVEDDPDIASLLALHLEDLGCQVKLSRDGRAGLTEAQQGHYDLIVLDLMLPGLDGLEITRRLRESSRYTPILMLTAKSSEIDRVVGLEVGADDYLTKPFSIRELLARVKALFRRVEAVTAAARAGEEEEGSEIHYRDLTIDVRKRRVELEGNLVELTAKEFDLLVYFARHPGRVYTRSELLDRVWGYAHDSYQHTVNSHINRLRAKIEKDPAHPEYVLTVWGVGYKFNDAAGGDRA
jgi:DNA-binding response OmpR family regulator